MRRIFLATPQAAFINWDFHDHSQSEKTMNAGSRLSGKHCLVTAAGAGIGRASALKFAGEGALVLATDIDLLALQTLAQEHPSIRTAELDVTDAARVATLI